MIQKMLVDHCFCSSFLPSSLAHKFTIAIYPTRIIFQHGLAAVFAKILTIPLYSKSLSSKILFSRIWYENNSLVLLPNSCLIYMFTQLSRYSHKLEIWCNQAVTRVCICFFFCSCIEKCDSNFHWSMIEF